MIFREPKYGYWIKIQHGNGPNFRAGTNDLDTHRLISDELDWKRTRKEAEKDLKEFAKRHNLERVNNGDTT